MLQVNDRVLASRNVTTLMVLTLLMLGAFIFMAALETIRGWVLVRVSARLDAALNQRVYVAAFERSLARSGGPAAFPIQDLNSVRQTLTGSALLAIFDTPWLPVYLTVIFMFSVELGLFSLGGAVLLAILAFVNERLSKPKLDEAQRVGTQSQAAMNNNLRNAEVIEAMGMLVPLHARWHKLHQKYLQLQARASDQAAIIGGMTKFVRIAMQSLVLGYGALLVIEGVMTAGMMIAASILVSRALAPVELLVANWKQIVTGRAAYRRLQEILAAHPPRESGMALPAPKGDVNVEGASAVAPGTKRLILNRLTFSLSAGEVVAIIGPSASGKSSLARLLVGVWPAVTGTVRLDGADIFRWNKDELGPYIGYLPQDIELFEGTVAENIARFGEADSAKVIEAAQRTGMHEHILRFPQGYDTPLGVDGGALSGGQRQRIALARALYGDPSLVVLDEPNSNLDDLGEKALIETIRDLKQRRKTVVLITHRLSTLAVVDKILVLAEGAIAAFGPRNDILAAMQGKAPPQAARPVAMLPASSAGAGA